MRLCGRIVVIVKLIAWSRYCHSKLDLEVAPTPSIMPKEDPSCISSKDVRNAEMNMKDPQRKFSHPSPDAWYSIHPTWHEPSFMLKRFICLDHRSYSHSNAPPPVLRHKPLSLTLESCSAGYRCFFLSLLLFCTDFFNSPSMHNPLSRPM